MPISPSVRDITQTIVDLKVKCNYAARLKGKDPIFHASLEAERLSSQLSSFSCQTEDGFKNFAEMIYKLIIESSNGGRRLPEDPGIDSMKLSIKKLRNYFDHVPEYGENSEVRRRYKQVGEIYRTLIGKEIPGEEDWQRLQNAMLQLVADSLQRVYELSVTEKPAENIPVYEDNRIYIIGKKPAKSRTAFKKDYLSPLAHIPVFMPEFALVSPPQLGLRKSVAYTTSKPPCYGRIDEFKNFVCAIEQKWLKEHYLRDTYGPFYWTISEDNNFTYGCGARNLVDELESHRRAGIGAILQGCFGEHYDRTCFLVLSAYRKGETILYIIVDLYLSCIPTNWDWFDELYGAHRYFSSLAEDVRIDHFTVEPLIATFWEPSEERRIKLKILGGIRRKGFGRSREDRETDDFAGTIIQNSSLGKLNYHLTDSWNAEFLTDIKFPLNALDECITSITNPVPTCSEIETGRIIDVNPPTVSMFLFKAYGATIYGIATNSMGPDIEE